MLAMASPFPLVIGIGSGLPNPAPPSSHSSAIRAASSNRGPSSSSPPENSKALEGCRLRPRHSPKLVSIEVKFRKGDALFSGKGYNRQLSTDLKMDERDRGGPLQCHPVNERDDIEFYDYKVLQSPTHTEQHLIPNPTFIFFSRNPAPTNLFD